MAVAAARLVLAAALVGALVASVAAHSPGPAGPIDFLAYFITQVTLLEIVALVASVVVLLRGQETPGWLVILRGAAVTYALVLATARLLVALPWQSTGGFSLPVPTVLLTLVAPLLLLLDWLVVGDRRPLTPSFLRWVAAYPVLWSALTLLRGIETGWTPYPVLNPAVSGARLPAFLVATVLFALAMGSIASWISRRPSWLPLHPESNDLPAVTRLIAEPNAVRPADLRRPEPPPARADPPEDQGTV